MDRAGLETMLMNYYRNIDREKVQFDFLTHRSKIGAYDDEIESLGGKIYRMPRLMPQNFLGYFKKMKDFFEEHKEYKIIHSHIDAMSTFPLRVAKKANIKVRIAHSHCSKIGWDLKFPMKWISKKMLPMYCNERFACGEKAGKFLFKEKKFKIINNAIDLMKFRFNDKIRKKVRKNLNVSEDAIVVGHVGRFINVKNQSFLIDVFAEALKLNDNMNLILVGAGQDESKLREKVKRLAIEEKVKFLINRPDVNELYQAMDCFVMPSLFEGLPVVGVEAQASGLPCIFSNKISKEVLMTKNSIMVDLSEGIDAWKKMLLSINKERNLESAKEVSELNYDIKVEAEKLMNIYLSFQKEEGIL